MQKALYWRIVFLTYTVLGEKGDILVSLCYNAPSAKLTVLILKCRDLEAKDFNGYSDPFVRVILMHNAKKLDKKKTSVRDKTLNPIYNESFVFNITHDKVRNAYVQLVVMDYDALSRNDFLGSVQLGANKGTTESKHWKEMLASSGQPVSYWHSLKEEH